jgi:hypothetical protein
MSLQRRTSSSAPAAQAPGRGTGAPGKNRHLLDKLSAQCYRFSELSDKAGSRFRQRRQQQLSRFSRNEMEIKSLKTNDSAKFSISHHQ